MSRIQDSPETGPFRNPSGREQVGGWEITKWMLRREIGPWSDTADTDPAGDPPPRRAQKGLRVTFVNHSTVLLQLDGLNILTDPIWAERASPVSWAGPKRMRPPGIRFDDLPPVDVVLVSHNHYDHLCLPTLERLRSRDDPAVFTGLGNARTIAKSGLRSITELGWWDAATLPNGSPVTYVPAEHFSARGPLDRNRALWGGFVVESPSARVYFAGDTAAGPHFAAIRQRLRAPDLALLPIGAYEPRHIMAPVHMNPAEAVEAHLSVGAGRSMAIHFGTFPLTDEGQWQPVEDLDRALADAGLTRDDFRVLDFGEALEVPTRHA